VRGQKGRNYIFDFPKQNSTMHSVDLKENDAKMEVKMQCRSEPHDQAYYLRPIAACRTDATNRR
jgi:hypothetical protein